MVVAVELLSAIVHPFPGDSEGTFEEACLHVELYPHRVLATAVVAWDLAALSATGTAGRLGNRGTGAFLGLLLMAAVVLNSAQLPYPPWFEAACLIAIPMGVVCGYRLSRRRVGNAAVSASSG